MKTRWTQFLGGFREHSLKLLLYSCALFLVELLGLELFLRNILAIVPEEYLLSYPHDDSIYVLLRLKKLNEQVSLPQPAVYVFGGSTMREAFLSDDEGIARLLGARLGTPVQFSDFGTTGQSVEDTGNLIAGVPINAKSLVIIGISNRRLAIPLDSGRFIPLTSALTTGGISFYKLSAIYAFRFWLRLWWSSRYPTGDLLSKYSYQRFSYPLDMVLTPEDFEEHIADLKTVNDLLLQNLGQNAKLLRVIISYIKRQGAKVILLEQPQEDLRVDVFKPTERLYLATVSRIVEEADVERWTAVTNPKLELSDYTTSAHFNKSGKVKFEAWFVDRVAQELSRPPFSFSSPKQHFMKK